jgi:predicted dehydrogenase
MLRVTIVGCGKIADQHVHAIRRIPDCSIVAVCDHEPLMAQQLAERFKISGVFSDAREMLSAVSPDVVHITTPPRSHFPLAKQCLEAGSHVYLEKPFAVTAAEATELIALADNKGLKITVGHNYQFTLEMMEMRRLVAGGFLGGKPVHVESYWGYSLGDASYVGPILGSKTHWVRQLPGQLLQNVISHGLAKLVEFLDDDLEITAQAHQSEQMRSLGGQEVQDELRVFIRDNSSMTAFFCFSTQIGPDLNCLRLGGPKNSLVVDQSSGSVFRLENKPCKSYLTYFVPPLRFARQHLRNAQTNIINFLRGRLHQDFGMKELIERFYTSIRLNSPPPIPYREILLTARIMDEIFAQIYSNTIARPVRAVIDQGARAEPRLPLTSVV